MKAVTRQCDVIKVAERIVAVCDEHTNNSGLARSAIQIAESVISSRQFAEESSLCAEAP
jgi:hypothetical protein